MELVKDGKLLGRTGASWAKILGFYAVYYTFLACLIYFSVTRYADNLQQPAPGVLPKIVTRTDMPGATAYPFTLISAADDGDGSCMSLGTNVNSGKARVYATAMNKFLESYSENAAGAVDCTNLEDVKSKTCRVMNAAKLIADDTIIERSLEAKKPIFTFSVNKKINWTPITTKGQPDIDGFVKNSVQAKCFEVSVDGVAVEDSKFKVELSQIEGKTYDNYLSPNFFPYQANDKGSEESKIPYNKPIFVGQILPQSEDAWTLGKDQNGNDEIFKFFQCKLYADNIEIPNIGAETTNTEGMGYVQFALNYQNDESAKC